MKYYEAIKNDYEDDRLYTNQGELTFTEYLAGSVFGFSTYESEVENTLVEWSIMASRAILNRSTFELISDEKKSFAYLTILQTCFFSDKIEWGTSIRGAWFCLDKCASTPPNFDIKTTDDLKEFMSDVIALYDKLKAT